MVDAHAIEEVFGDKLAQQAVSVFENQRVFLAYPGEPVDREEPAIRDDPVAPEHQAVGLAGVDLLRVVVDTVVGSGSQREILVKVGEHILAFGGHARRKLLRREVDEAQLGFVALFAQHGHTQFATGAVVLVPVDVKKGGVLGFLAVLEHIPPPAVVVWHFHADVVGHDIGDQPEAGFLCLGCERAQPVDAAELWVDFGGIQHVVAVVGIRHGREDGGEVEVGHPQRAQIGDALHGLGEAEGAPGGIRPGTAQLQAVGRSDRLTHDVTLLVRACLTHGNASLPVHPTYCSEKPAGKPGLAEAQRCAGRDGQQRKAKRVAHETLPAQCLRNLPRDGVERKQGVVVTDVVRQLVAWAKRGNEMVVQALEGLRVGEPARSGAPARLDLDPGRELARRTSE